MRKKAGILMCCLMVVFLSVSTFSSRIYAEDTEVMQIQTDTSLTTAPSAILMEASTGQILYEKDGDSRRSPASITKIMTLILIFDAIQEGKITMEDLVTTSAYAKSMGGSQVYLEEGEQQTVETLIKCIVIASGNDASVTMAEHIAGSETEFVKQMNQRAEGLGMTNTHFEDCCGLTDSAEHYSSAKDVALMSRELITKYPKVLEYSSIWMENITHVTRKGSSEFGLTNTNKLLRNYTGCKGLKTGSTSVAKYCFSGVAERNGISLIAVVMAAPEPKVRFKDAANLLDFGFSRCSLFRDQEREALPDLPVRAGMQEKVELDYEAEFQYLRTDGKPIGEIRRELLLPENVTAPVKKGDTVGEMCYYMEDTELGRIRIICKDSVAKATYLFCVKKIFTAAFGKEKAA